MMSLRKYRLTLIAFVLFAFISSILPFFSFEGYNIISHTTSHLGAQGSPNAVMMNVGFIILGLSFIIELLVIEYKRYYFHKLVGVLFGIGLIGSALFRHEPLVNSIEVNVFADQIHSIFASLTGFSFTLYALAHLFTEPKNNVKILSLFAMLISSGFSFIILSISSVSGLFQRVMFLIAFCYIIYLFELKRQNIEVHND